MNSKIDWSKAPEGTKGFAEIGLSRKHVWFGDNWYEYVGGVRYGFACHRDDKSGRFAPEEMVNIRRRPELIETEFWNGTGLPPVGTECEGNEYGEWVKLEIIAHYEGRAVCVLPCKERVALADPGMLRPIRTAEQIAAEEREEAVQQMLSVVKGMDAGMYTICCALYDAGFIKTGASHE